MVKNTRLHKAATEKSRRWQRNARLSYFLCIIAKKVATCQSNHDPKRQPKSFAQPTHCIRAWILLLQQRPCYVAVPGSMIVKSCFSCFCLRNGKHSVERIVLQTSLAAKHVYSKAAILRIKYFRLREDLPRRAYRKSRYLKALHSPFMFPMHEFAELKSWEICVLLSSIAAKNIQSEAARI